MAFIAIVIIYFAISCTATIYSVWKFRQIEKEISLHKTELIRLAQWSQSAASTIHEITQHLRYIVEMDKTKKQFPFWGVKGEA